MVDKNIFHDVLHGQLQLELIRIIVYVKVKFYNLCECYNLSLSNCMLYSAYIAYCMYIHWVWENVEFYIQEYSLKCTERYCIIFLSRSRWLYYKSVAPSEMKSYQNKI